MFGKVEERSGIQSIRPTYDLVRSRNMRWIGELTSDTHGAYTKDFKYRNTNGEIRRGSDSGDSYGGLCSNVC
jgi:hypothetical protein